MCMCVVCVCVYVCVCVCSQTSLDGQGMVKLQPVVSGPDFQLEFPFTVRWLFSKKSPGSLRNVHKKCPLVFCDTLNEIIPLWCSEAARGCQERPGAARACQERPGAA